MSRSIQKVRNETSILHLLTDWGEQNMGNAQWKWEELYTKAFLETNPLSLSDRVAAAENAIGSRTSELRTSPDGELEWQAIENATKGLSILKREIKPPIGINAITYEQPSRGAFHPNHPHGDGL